MNVLYLNSDKMGEGDDELGRRLLLIFLEKLAGSDAPIDAVGCVNSGIRLTTEEGQALASLQALAARGARVLTCGTCLDYHDKREALLIGEVGSMDGTVAMMMTAERIIRP
jgi:selenium metabolism protein YedF